jgi:ABC-type glutathione transport system ATPase component
MSKPIITFENVTKRFGKMVAVDDVSLTIQEGEFFSLLGPSGCGKTTLLRMLAGFETPTEGRILIDGQDISNVPPNKRPVNMVFQSYAVFPHMSVADNVAYGLKVDKVSKAERDRRVEEALDLVQLGGWPSASPTSCRAASASAWPWPGRWSSGRACCCWTSRCRPWTPSCASRCAPSCAPCRRRSASPSSWSPTTRTRPWPWRPAAR